MKTEKKFAFVHAINGEEVTVNLSVWGNAPVLDTIQVTKAAAARAKVGDLISYSQGKRIAVQMQTGSAYQNMINSINN